MSYSRKRYTRAWRTGGWDHWRPSWRWATICIFWPMFLALWFLALWMRVLWIQSALKKVKSFRSQTTALNVWKGNWKSWLWTYRHQSLLLNFAILGVRRKTEPFEISQPEWLWGQDLIPGFLTQSPWLSLLSCECSLVLASYIAQSPLKKINQELL